MENKYVLFPKAKSDLENIFRYISIDLCNKEAANRLILKFETKFIQLTQFPYSCPLIQHELLNYEYLRKCRVDNYLVIYFYNDIINTVEIVRVIYAKKDYLDDITES